MKAIKLYPALAAGISGAVLFYCAADVQLRGGDESNRLERREKRFGKVGQPGDETHEAQIGLEQFAEARTAPGLVQPGAYSAAFTSLLALPVYGKDRWTEVTNRPYDSDDARYRDPYYSNSSGGSGVVAGRVTGLAVGGSFIFAGGADGGVFRSGDGGNNWTPLTDSLPTLSVGDVELAADGALWLATGEGNTGGTSYVGSGVYRLPSPGSSVFATTNRVGGTELESTMINKLKFDDVGNVYAATSRGVWKHVANTNAGAWTRVLYPVAGSQSPYDNICNDVAITPNTGGKRVIANCAWRGGAAYNGFYLSTDGGNSFAKINPTGALNAQDIGNTEFAYSADGSHLYAVVESINRYTNTANTCLSGIYDSPGGDVAGPWNKIADSQKLAGSGSALKLYQGYRPGVQAWYNNFIIVDPADSKHAVVGLEEVYETKDAGVSWTTIGPYWNFEFPCWNISDSLNTCAKTPHSDQHSVAIANGKLYVGNDGGVYARNLDGTGGWQSLNANLRTLQYYSVGVGKVPGGFSVSGGLQDNGQSLLLPEDRATGGKMGSPFGGDGGDTLVDPDDGCKIVAEYVFLDMELTETCGRSTGSPGAIRSIAPADPYPRFIAPFRADGANKDHWVAGGQYVWTNTRGFAIQNGSQWTKVFDQGSGHSTTTIASRSDAIWTAWCGPCNNSGFTRGISTNAGGSWRQLTLPAEVPNRYISGLAVDPADPSGRTAYVGFNGFSRTWTEGPGAGIGHLWKTTDAGATWTNVSGDLPDIPVDDIVINGGKLVVATDLATLISIDGGAHWSRLGTGLPATTVMDLNLAPDGQLYAATHGRGIWSIKAP
ncbi:MAG: WD40/YVTN/BNR-like repeat-containing protein [Chthoniobacterales bacterium]